MKRYKKIREIVFPEREFWSKVLRFSIPIALQNMSVALFAIIDVSIISITGESGVAAVALANQILYVTNLITFGITSGASVLLARHFGAKNKTGVKQTFAIMLFLTTIINFLIAAVSLISPASVISIYTDEAPLIKEGAAYLWIIAPTFALFGIKASLIAFFRSTNKPSIPMVVTLISIVLKTLLNFAFMYGFWLIPALGLIGIAVATLISNILEFIIYICYYMKIKEQEYKFTFHDIRCLKKGNIIIFLQETYPVIANEGLWGIGLSAFSAIFGRMGALTVSAVSVAQQFENLCNSFFYGIGIGACVVISYAVGEKRYDEAKRLSRQYAVAGFEVGIIIMLLMFSVHNIYINGFFQHLTQGTRETAKLLIIIYALYMPFRSLASALIMGVLRAGGDSKKAMLYDVAPIYLWSLPLGVLTGIILKWPIAAVLAIMQFKRVIKTFFALKRLFSDKWIAFQKVSGKEIGV